jgi:hypothetical protein
MIVINQQMQREIVILDCHEISCPTVLMFIFKDLCGYFERRNIVVKIAKNLSELHDNSVVFMGNMFHVDNPVEVLKKQAPKSLYIGWYWRNMDVSQLEHFIHIYEDVRNIYYDQHRIKEFVYLTTIVNSVPLLLRANEDPKLVGRYERNVERDFCYMGWCHHSLLELIPRNEYTGFCHGVIYHHEYFDYDKRREIYLSSTFALGIQSQEAVAGKVVTQRIYEALAYGCVVLTNSQGACEQTDNIVVYVSSREEVEKTMSYYKENPNLILEKQRQGYELIKKCGTNELSMQKIKDKCETLFGFGF